MANQREYMGRTDFVERHELWDGDEHEQVDRVLHAVEENQLEVVRLSFADQHGILRGKSVVVDELPQALRNGCTNTTTLLAKDTSHKTVFPVFTSGGGLNIPGMSNAGDLVMVPLPSTFRILPWASKTGWMLCDIYFANGERIPFSTRQILKDALKELSNKGFGYLAGLEVEMHIYKLEDAKLEPEHAGQPASPPDVSLLAHGFHYLTETRMDEFEPVLEFIRANLIKLGLPLRTFEVEFGPSQIEITFKPTFGLEAADNMMLFRSAMKQICKRHGYHVTFMCRPGLDNAFSSGWHLHQSLMNTIDSSNAFMPQTKNEILSPLGMSFVAGILEHASAAAVFTTPTLNGYKRYKPNSLAPNSIVWGNDNKGAMLRVIGAGINDPATHLENRVGEPAANPYLYMTSQILSGMDGVSKDMTPQPPTEEPYSPGAKLLPTNLLEAIDALRQSKMFRNKMGDQFVDYLLHIKTAEVTRFFSEVTDWEHREYFEIY
ncbi:glutamine synthetase family protein [Rhodospirillales bacterium]|nr:glutamine synthetase family protein [Rhodospirillales bacterium]